MILFENKPRKVSAEELRSRLGVDARELPDSRESLKAAFRAMPPECFFPASQEDYERRKSGSLFTNYLSHFDPRTAACAGRAAEFLGAKSGFPIRVWSTGILRREGETSEHQDWYDGILVNLAGRKIVTVLDSVDVRPPAVYRYRFELRGLAAGSRFVLEPGEAFFLPAFSAHAVENGDDAETAAVSLAFDATALLTDLFPRALEFCLGRAPSGFRVRSAFGPRLWGSRERWGAWRADARNPDAPVLREIETELSRELSESAALLGGEADAAALGRAGWAGDVLRSSSEARALLRAEWEALLLDPSRFSARACRNP